MIKELYWLKLDEEITPSNNKIKLRKVHKMAYQQTKHNYKACPLKYK